MQNKKISPDVQSDEILELAVAEKILALHGGNVSEEIMPLPRDLEEEYKREGKPFPTYWNLNDDYGGISLDGGPETRAKITGAIVLYLWERGVEISFARDLACSYMDRRIGRKVGE